MAAPDKVRDAKQLKNIFLLGKIVQMFSQNTEARYLSIKTSFLKQKIATLAQCYTEPLIDL